MNKTLIFSLFFSIFSFATSLFAMKAVKYDRYFVDQGKKHHETVTITSNLMRVEGDSYKYILDMSTSTLTYTENSSKFGVKIPFRTLIRQIRRGYIPYKSSLEGLKVKRADKLEKYKMFMTIKSTVVIKGDGFMTLRFVKKAPHNIFVRKFFDSLYLKFGMVPFKFNSQGVVSDNIFNNMAATVEAAYDYDSKGIQRFPVYIYKSSSVSQVNLSSLKSITTTRGLMYKDIVNIKKKTWYTDLFKQVEHYYSKTIELVMQVLFGKTSKITTGSDDLASKVDAIHARPKKGIEYELFWKTRECGFRKLRSRLLFLTGNGKGFILDGRGMAAMKGWYKDMLTKLPKLKSYDKTYIDDMLRDGVKGILRKYGYKRAKVRKSTLVKHANLCYLKIRLYKSYKHLVKSQAVEE